jgi:hypothetical protein
VIDTPHAQSPHSVHVVSEKSKVGQVGRECKRTEAEHGWRAVSYAGACMGRCARGVVHASGADACGTSTLAGLRSNVQREYTRSLGQDYACLVCHPPELGPGSAEEPWLSVIAANGEH